MRFTLVRLPRLLKVGAYTELLYRLDAVLSRPYIIRILRVRQNTINFSAFAQITTFRNAGREQHALPHPLERLRLLRHIGIRGHCVQRLRVRRTGGRFILSE